ncbi:hypothetical protein HDE_05872 [Halotydeus destructor]|nr:hypothetical protein HDE_05872 [Halotydeus destructor]
MTIKLSSLHLLILVCIPICELDAESCTLHVLPYDIRSEKLQLVKQRVRRDWTILGTITKLLPVIQVAESILNIIDKLVDVVPKVWCLFVTCQPIPAPELPGPTTTPVPPEVIIDRAVFEANFRQDSALVTTELQQVRRVFHRLSNQFNEFQPLDLTLVASSMHRLITRANEDSFALRQSPLAMMEYLNYLVALYDKIAQVAICIRPSLIPEFAEDMSSLKKLSVELTMSFTKAQVNAALAIMSLRDRFYGVHQASYHEDNMGIGNCNQKLQDSAKKLVLQVVESWSQVDVTVHLGVNVTELCAGTESLMLQEVAQDGDSSYMTLVIVASLLVLLVVATCVAVTYFKGFGNRNRGVNQHKTSASRKVKHSSKSSEKTSGSYTTVTRNLMTIPVPAYPGGQVENQWSGFGLPSRGRHGLPGKGNLLAVTHGPSGPTAASPLGGRCTIMEMDDMSKQYS